ncbi:DUF2905 domain-containing protein [Telluribacter sp.]|jgi:hypothetical protein|uniref:DUF2905 domain-containing protein n=1 Tax=Telluribacter sp. TaxID=1978767 RepID=UPI002E0E10F7|nr:DUF2905 domain-containing protein [Telluribacter sp.]
MSPNTGKFLIIIGLLIAVVGVLFYFFHDKLNWIGRLPGDIRVEREGFRFYFPLATMLLFSLLLNLIIVLIRKFFG